MTLMNPNVAKPGRITNRMLAADPGTPIERLVQLAGKYPSEVMQNPAFQVAMLCDPGIALTLDSQAMHAMLRVPDAEPDFLLSCAARLPELRRISARLPVLLAQNPAAPAAAIACFDKAPEEWLARLHVASRHAFAEPWREKVRSVLHDRDAGLERDHDARVIAGLARAGLVDADDDFVRMLIANAAGPCSRRFLQHQPSMSPQALEELLADHVDRLVQRVREAVSPHRSATRGPKVAKAPLQEGDAIALSLSTLAANRRRAVSEGGRWLDAAVIRKLAADPAASVRAAVAGMPSLGLAESVSLAADQEVRVRQALAEATRHPHLLETLAADPHPNVRVAVAANPACSPALRARIADRSALLACLRTSWQEGRRLACSGRPFVQPDPSDRWGGEECAMLALRTPRHGLARVIFVAGAGCPVEVLCDHATSECWWSRIAVARNPRTPAEIVAHLAARDANWVVRAAASEALDARTRREQGPPAASPIPAEFISEPHMPAEGLDAIERARALFANGGADEVCAGVRIALSHPVSRRLLCAGMLVGRRGIRSTALSEIRRRVASRLEATAEGYLAMELWPSGVQG